jgi:halogenation protein CepH
MSREPIGTAESWDVVVIGGGPAGAATAISAQKRGRRALVLEADTFPRHHVGESLVSLWPVFETLGVADEMDATFQHKRGSCRIWGRDPIIKWTDFESRVGSRDYSLQVERSLFDSILLRRAADAGATVREGQRVGAVLWDGGRAVGVRYRAPNGDDREARAPFVVDASGRSSVIARQLRLHTVDPFYPDLSVYGYVKDARRFEGAHAGNLFIEAVPRGWFWFIPLHTGLVSVGLVCDRSTRRRLQERGLTRFFEEAVASSAMTRRLLEPSTLVWGPTATASHGYSSARYAGPGWLVTGDAGAFVDPMWATGVANALVDGTLAGAVVEAVLSGRSREGDACSFYDRELAGRADRILTLVKFVYRSNRLHADQPFWSRRHRALEGEQLQVGQIMRRFARDPSVQYFRTAFGGMGVDSNTLAPLDEEIGRIDQQERSVGQLLQDLDGWVPRLRSTVTLRRGLGLHADRIVHGLEVDNDGVTEFTGDPFTAAALEGIDGRRTARELIDAVVDTAPAGEALLTRFRLMATFLVAHRHGILDARPA